MAGVAAAIAAAVAAGSPPPEGYTAFLDEWAEVQPLASGTGCSPTTTVWSDAGLSFENPTTVLLQPSTATEFGENYRVWQAQFGLITALLGHNPDAPLYLWLNVSAGPMDSLRRVDVWVCDHITTSGIGFTATSNQLFRRCGTPGALNYTIPCDESGFSPPNLQCKCKGDTEYAWSTSATCDAWCALQTGGPACVDARHVLKHSLAPTAKPTAAPSPPPSHIPTPGVVSGLGCGTVIWSNSGCTGSVPATDLRESVTCTVTSGGSAATYRLSRYVEVCTCTAFAAALSAKVSGAPTFACSGATYDPLPGTAPGAQTAGPGMTRCNTLGSAQPTQQCTSSAEVVWCRSGTYWEVANWTISDPVLAPWDPATTTGINTEIQTYLEAAYALATTAETNEVCLCAANRMPGWASGVMQQWITESPVAASSTTPWPTSSWTSPPTPRPTAAPTAAPSTAAPSPTTAPPPTAPVSAPTTASPSIGPTTAAPTPASPTVEPTFYVGEWHDPDFTERAFWPIDDANVEYVWAYRPRGPYLVEGPLGTLMVNPEVRNANTIVSRGLTSGWTRLAHHLCGVDANDPPSSLRWPATPTFSSRRRPGARRRRGAAWSNRLRWAAGRSACGAASSLRCRTRAWRR